MFDLKQYDIHQPTVLRNLSPGELYEEALKHEKGTMIVSSGALAVQSGRKTGRSPSDKRIVEHPDSSSDIWWGNVNIKLPPRIFDINWERANDYLDTLDRVYVTDAFAGWDPTHRLKIRVVCARAYHALFMHNMLIRATQEELDNFGEPDYVILNAGRFPANRYTEQMTSDTSVDISFEQKRVVILGTEYAGEMKKGVFTIMHHLMPAAGVLSMHCSANQGESGDTTLFFGLSGTGKTTLSADAHRRLIGDDEHCWTNSGIFNIEGGCYAKCAGLSREKEPEIWDAVRFGSLLENVVVDPGTRRVDFDDTTLTENTRVAYPIEFIENALVPCIGGHPKNIILLTCDAFGVLPPVSRLTPEQAMYHFISGYTAKVAGTEQGLNEPSATFSACFGAAFLVRHPSVYAELLAAKMRMHGTNVWLVNTGWSGGGPGVGKRMKLAYTRAIIDAIHAGSLGNVEMAADPIFGVAVPTSCPSVPSEILQPRNAWSDGKAFDAAAWHLADLFHKNFSKYSEGCSPAIRNAGPRQVATA